MKSFKEMYEAVKDLNPKIVAVAQAADVDVLLAVKDAYEKGIIKAVLVGDKSEIERLALSISMPLKDHEIIDVKDDEKACRAAAKLVSDGQADMIMKGLVPTSVILKAVLDKEFDLRSDRLLSHVAVFESSFNRLMLLSDAAMNISPDLKAKIDIIYNAAYVAKKLCIRDPKVAVLAAVEMVNPAMQATIDAAILAKMSDRGQFKGMIVDGPLALDNALSIESAYHKGIISTVAGNADILIVPDIEAGNMLYKAITFIANKRIAGIIVGAKKPVILTSRSDSKESKFNSILLASIVASDKNI
ncbi:phosphate butyryltransferase [Thermoanaerobacterium xylanolyticum LX-11]|uniref:Phosphate butyryltransferase n=1 Tax=Thermoanaerobacterium xylanolyticum (strain ATCC 49914 / DSM 7097 / LX-11) TaxID=858215 RepID=F6BHR6_THEXL|nr:phosphate butyryltransferase [Thermoanaerobacterium xylanolyticum]AEF17665.1 phosphate butyryltransferase [Thermoanaerobacterium xylanolyticum LX-11]